MKLNNLLIVLIVILFQSCSNNVTKDEQTSFKDNFTDITSKSNYQLSQFIKSFKTIITDAILTNEKLNYILIKSSGDSIIIFNALNSTISSFESSINLLNNLQTDNTAEKELRNETIKYYKTWNIVLNKDFKNLFEDLTIMGWNLTSEKINILENDLNTLLKMQSSLEKVQEKFLRYPLNNNNIDNLNKEILYGRSAAEQYCTDGETFSMNGQLNKAEEILLRAIIADSTYEVSYHDIAILYFLFEEDSTSIVNSNKAIELNSNFANAYSQRAMTYTRMGKYELAINDCNKAISLDPDHCWFYGNKGITFFYNDKPNEAIEQYNIALTKTKSPENKSMIYGYIGNALRKLNLYDKALENYNNSLNLNINNPEANWNRAVTLQDNLKRANEACENIQKCIELNYETFHAKFRKLKFCNNNIL